MDFVSIWNTPEGRYMFAYCLCLTMPLLGMAFLLGAMVKTDKGW
jgi:hypothetical protein